MPAPAPAHNTTHGPNTVHNAEGPVSPAPAGTGPQGATAGVRAIVRDHGVRDHVAIEEPLEIRVNGEPLAVTMRTPGHDEELAVGFLYGEGLIDGPPCDRPPRAAPPLALPLQVGPTRDFAANTIEVSVTLLRELPARRFYTTSSCGVCGKGALDEVRALVDALGDRPASSGLRWTRELLASLPGRLVQPGFQRTGGTHATGLFGADGGLLFAYEDVGRHNAMDKTVGRALLDGLLPLREQHALCVSGRLSFELVQKAAVAGAPVLVGVGAPSSLAIELARAQRMILCGFARGGRLNVYAGAERVVHRRPAGSPTPPP